ncbi:hypothetical protein ACHAXA_005404 [Cyclostephanos tholiformis]|uniref:DUF1995 domain-containing protein n=1 Tax=Cyclostephanos tholiformis TaxID=382380 RepID=A0ABD3REQ5_9STRA
MERIKNDVVTMYLALGIVVAISALCPHASALKFPVTTKFGPRCRPRRGTTTTTSSTIFTATPRAFFGVGGGVEQTMGSGRYPPASSLSSSSSSSSSSPPLSPIPRGISPFEKTISRNMNVQADFRRIAKYALDSALRDGITKIEIEFPPLIGGGGGRKSKSQFDDFDNVQELDGNMEWTMSLAPMFMDDAAYRNGKTWLIFPDLKECELAKGEWTGRRYREATFTTIEAATNHFLGDAAYDAPWGSNLVSGISKLMGGADGDAGLLGDRASLDPIISGENYPATLYLVIQPGNGGPVEDWVNCEKMSKASPNTPMVIINGALDKVRGGYYPAIFFPKLARTVDGFYNKFDSVFYLKPFSDKGAYGWLYRVYPEPWQVVWEDVKPGKDGNPEVNYVTVGVLDKRPTYADVISLLVKANQKSKR